MNNWQINGAVDRNSPRACIRLLWFAALLGCAGSASNKPEPERDPFEDIPGCSFFECTMAGDRCPSADLPRFEAELDTAGWARLRELRGVRFGRTAAREVVGLGAIRRVLVDE